MPPHASGGSGRSVRGFRFLLGFDFGAHLKLSGKPTVTVPPGASQSQIDKVHKLADIGSSYPLPSLRLRIGWMI